MPGSAEGASELLEEALVASVGVLAGQRLEAVEQLALLVGQVARHGHVHEHPVIAAAGALQRRHSLAAEHAHLAGLRARLEVELDVARERGHGELHALRRLDDRQVDRGENIVAVALEAGIARDVHLDIGVAWKAAACPGVTGAADPDPLAVVDSSGDLDLELGLLERAALAVAARARRLDDAARAGARRAGLGADELA